MWVVEGYFRDIDAADIKVQAKLRERWLRPTRTYSLGRDLGNDFSIEKPKTLSRWCSIELNAGSYSMSDQSEPAELPRPYPLSLTNNLNKGLHLGRGENPNITIEPRASVSIEPDDQIFLNPSDPSVDSIRFHWRPVYICISPSRQAHDSQKYNDSGFLSSISRLPSKHHTHFLPIPLKPTVPVGCALVRGIQLISQSWLDDFLEATHINRPTTQKPPPNILRKEGDTEVMYQQRCQQVISIYESRSKGFSSFEKDFKDAWSQLVPQISFSQVPSSFENWGKDPVKFDPNPARRSLFSDISVIFLVNQEDQNSMEVEEVVRAGLGRIVTHTSPSDQSSPSHPQLQELWPKPARPEYRVVIKAKDYVSMPGSEIEGEKTVNDLLHAIYYVDKGRLVNQFHYHEVPVDDDHTDNPTLPDETPTIAQRCSTPTRMAIGDNSTFTEPDSSPGPELIRRTVSRTDDERMKELLSHSEPGENEIEALQKLARVDDSVDETVISIQPEAREETPPPTTNQLGGENTGRLDPKSGSQSSSLGSSPPLLKREVRGERELNLDQFVTFFCEETGKKSGNTDQVVIGDGLIDPPAKRQKLEHCPEDGSTSITRSTSRLDEVDINNIEGPVSKMLRETATQRVHDLKRKATTDLSPGDEDGSLENTEKDEQPKKKARIQSRQELERSRSDLSAAGEKGTKRKPSGRANAQSPKKLRSQKVDPDEHEAEDLGDRYLSVKTTGKRLTEEEVRTNLEFNQLRISKPRTILKTRPIPTRPIGWDEEDQSENELREMDDWKRQGTQPDSSKSFFKVRYVNLIKKQPVSRHDLEDRPSSDGSPNFKKFKPKNGQAPPHTYTPAKPYTRRNLKMTTDRLQPSNIDDHEHARKSREKSSTQVPIEMDDEDDDMEAESAPKTTTKGKGRADRTKSARSAVGSQTTLNFGAKSKHSKDGTADEQPQRTSRSGKSRAPDPSSESEEDPSPKKPPPSTRTLTRPSRTQTKSQRTKRVVSVDNGSESDGDELAFKGFTRTRA
ncbi:hypothetical protein PGT21_024492 [Puccinia graminis f. sp. tritici]|uniref:BRCT domain-containing protein n=1 Tax=Puccinia graminis f. sp. tritici TaxID=56615 RepID=A0A5B0PE73_PUCGR|nr:hypothetical protein PGT21_024492 [Puccinia graminis f. sp. tritici]KAA1123475.1 hypothetical protein PGTUg99_017729 [Puccinia graminis f. sp. tritici]